MRAGFLAGFEKGGAKAISNSLSPCQLFNNFLVLRIPGQQLRPPCNLHVLILKSGRHRAPNQSELSRAPLFSRKPAPWFYNDLERFSHIEVAPQSLFDQTALWIDDVDRRRIPLEKTPYF